MDKAYWNEPTPLAQAYPREHNGLYWMQILGFALLLVGLVGILTSWEEWNIPLWKFLLPWSFPFVLSALCFVLSPKVARATYNRAWKKAFVRNNADLKLFYGAIDMVIAHLRANTGYRNVGFKNVAVNLATSLRNREPFNQSHHTSFSWEVLHAYYHFMDGSQPLVIPSVPR